MPAANPKERQARPARIRKQVWDGSGSWKDFEWGWWQYMANAHFRTLPGLEPVVPKYRKTAGAVAPSEDDAGTGLGEAERYLVVPVRNSPVAGPPIHPRPLRCSSVT
jgi:hypothetical protein